MFSHRSQAALPSKEVFISKSIHCCLDDSFFMVTAYYKLEHKTLIQPNGYSSERKYHCLQYAQNIYKNMFWSGKKKLKF